MIRPKHITKAEQQHMERVQALGCIVCRNSGLGVSPAEIHHVLKNGRRMGHMFVLPLCWMHHRSGENSVWVSRHPHKREFERRYGTEKELLAQVERELEKGRAA